MAQSDELKRLLAEGLDLCARARKLDDMPDGSPALWAEEQYQRDLADWERRAANAISQTGA